MKWKTSSKTIRVTTIVLITVLIGLAGVNTSIISNKTIIPCSTAASPTVPWNITLMINESSGAGNTVVFGEETNASDDQDIYDMPAPPMPPQFPAISAWFETPFPQPFSKLIYEFKHYPSNYSSWNLSILWLPSPGNTTPTSITLHWDSTQILKNPDKTLFLYENNTVLTNMLTTHSYSYITNTSLHSFQIISQNQPSNNSSEQNTIPILPLIIFILVLFMIIIIVLLLLYMRRKKSRLSEKNKSLTLEQNKLQVSEKKNSQALEKKKSQVSTKKHKKSQKKQKRKNK